MNLNINNRKVIKERRLFDRRKAVKTTRYNRKVSKGTTTTPLLPEAMISAD